jgi:polar amino acid transport system permease protein/polar amino acid transport system substrate-binding protein
MDILRTLQETFLNLDAMGQALPELITVGLPNTLILALCSAVLGTMAGMLLAVSGLSRSRWLRWPARIYTDIFWGLPAAVTILLIGVGLAPLGLAIWGPNPYPLGILALSLIASAYIGEIFRSGIQSVEPGQLEAARALGFSRSIGMRLVVIPQGVRRVLPAVGTSSSRSSRSLHLSTSWGCWPLSVTCSGSARTRPPTPGTGRRCCSRACSTC